ncbi:MAG TPA: DUF2066 domain-containing protein [Gammaproteobacteria bacterium]|nr:DUF2066 domain-containing protein [Gammaproteobacteria bacterium]
MFRRLHAVLLFTACTAVQATTVTGLYEVSVPVTDQGVEARRQALEDALAAVLVRVTGERAVNRLPELTGMLRNPARYLQQYRYEEIAPASGSGGTGTATSLPALQLWARFDAAALERALHEAGAPLWGAERPSTLVWIAFDDGIQRALLGRESLPEWFAVIEETARTRGLPLVMPLLDLEDRQALEARDIFAFDEMRLQQASARYNPNAVLAGALQRDRVSGRWSATWMLLRAAEVSQWQDERATVPEVLAEAVHLLADRYAAQYAVRDGGALHGVTLAVSGITTLEAYGAVTSYLTSLALVEEVTVVELAGDVLVLKLAIRGERHHLEQVIGLDDRLVPVTAPAATMQAAVPPAVVDLYYRYGS